MDAAQEAWLLLRSLIALLIVIALAYISLRFGLPWLMQRREKGHTRRLHIEEFCPLDRNHRLYIVRWDDSRLLLATSPDRVQLLQSRPESGGIDFEATLESMGRTDPKNGVDRR